MILSLLRLHSGGSAPARGFGKLTSLQFCPPLQLSSSVVHPLSIRAPRACPDSQLQLGLPAAPEAYYLPLLPSGPDGVRSASPRRARLSTLTCREQSPRTLDLEREFNPAIADCGYRAPLAPRLARPHASYHNGGPHCQAAHKCSENTIYIQPSNCYVPVIVVIMPRPPDKTLRRLRAEVRFVVSGVWIAKNSGIVRPLTPRPAHPQVQHI